MLAKGGNKLPDPLSKSGENSQIVDLFFDRKPTDKLTVTLGLGIRDMYELGSDFVHKELQKSLSMEFDWKRQPKEPQMSSGYLPNDKTYNHLSFKTQPWVTVEQFQKTRFIWEQYNQTKRSCLKTEQDLEAFAAFHENILSTDGSASKYLRKEGGDLKRLRQELLIARRLRKAGTHELKPHAFGRTNIFPTYKLKAREIAELLDQDLGIPCSKADVDNAAKKKVFTPHQVPNTQAVRSKLCLLKRHLFPRLVIDEFVTGKAEFSLIADR